MPVLFASLFLIAGAGFGFGIWHFFRRMPSKWLLDYDETEVTDALRAAQNLRLLPGGLLLIVADALVFLLGWIFLGLTLQLPAVLLAAQPLLLIIVADFRTRIIPDQFIVALLPSAALLWIADSLVGEPALLFGLLYRVLGGLIGGGLLFLAGWLGELIAKKEAMGWGDIKLLAACGLMVSLFNMPALIALSFVSAAFIALPMLIRKLRNPELANDMAFGPFIALATLLVLLFSPLINDLWNMYLGLLL